MRLSNRQHQVALLLLLAPFIAVSQVLSLNASRERDLHAFDDARFIAHLDARIPELMEDQGIPGVGIFLIKILTNSQRNWPFFAQILEDWSRWRGFGPVGMSRIVPAQAAMRTIIGWILLASLWCVWRIGQGVSTGNRRPSLRGGLAPETRIAEIAISLVLLSVLWSVSQEYLFISSGVSGQLDLAGRLPSAALRCAADVSAAAGRSEGQKYARHGTREYDSTGRS